MENLVVKVWFEREGGGEPEIRRFSVPEDVDSTYNYICGKVTEVFSDLEPEQFNMYWKDAEGDLVIFSSQEELTEALSSATDSLLKVVIKSTKSATMKGRVTAPDGTGHWRRAVRYMVENMNADTAPPRFVYRRWMRKSRNGGQQDEGASTPHTEHSKMQTDIMDFTPTRHENVGRGWRYRRAWQIQNPHRRRFDKMGNQGGETEVISESAKPAEDPCYSGKPPTAFTRQERIQQRQKRRQQMLQELQQWVPSVACHASFHPRWRAQLKNSAGNADITSDLSYEGCQDVGCNYGFRENRSLSRRMSEWAMINRETGESATYVNGCDAFFPSSGFARRRTWGRMKCSRDHRNGEGESFASCQRRRARCIKREEMLKALDPCIERKLSKKHDGTSGCPKQRVRFEDNVTDMQTRSSQTEDNKDTEESTSYSKFTRTTNVCGRRTGRRHGQWVQQAQSPRLFLKQRRRISGLSAYRHRVLERLHRLRHLKALAEAECQQSPRGANKTRRRSFQTAHEDILSKQGRPVHTGRRLVRGSRPGHYGIHHFLSLPRCGLNVRKAQAELKNQVGVRSPVASSTDRRMRWRRLMKMWKRQHHTLAPRRSPCRRFLQTPAGQGLRQKGATGMLCSHTTGRRAVQRNANNLNSMKIFIQKQKRMMDVGGQHAPSTTENSCFFLPVYSRRGNCIPRRGRFAVMYC